MENEPLTLAQWNAAKTAAVQPISDALGDINALVDALDPELFFGGLGPSLNQMKSQLEGMRSAIKRDYGTTFVSSFGA